MDLVFSLDSAALKHSQLSLFCLKFSKLINLTSQLPVFFKTNRARTYANYSKQIRVIDCFMQTTNSNARFVHRRFADRFKNFLPNISVKRVLVAVRWLHIMNIY